MAQKPAGWNPSTLAPKASTDSGDVPSENIVGRSLPTNSAGARSTRTIA
jgi:hypothetical protein